jgi:hypothetical protein
MAATAPVRERRVGRLHLRATNAAQVRRGALCIEDALRCASLPGQGASLLLVRRLALGRVDPAAPSQTVALAIERRVRALSLHWCHGADDAAQRADAVWFADRTQALTSLALRVADARSTKAWYWPRLLLPELVPQGVLPAGAALLPAVLLTLSREPAARTTLPELMVTLLQRWPRRRLADVVGPVVGAALLHNAGIVAAQVHWIDRWVALAAPGPATVAWQGERAGFAPAVAPEPVGVVPPLGSQTVGEHRQGASARPSSHRATLDALAAPLDGHRAGAGPAAPDALAGPVDHQRARAGPAAPGLPFERPVPTAAGGCLFLLPLLDRLGFGAWNEMADPHQRLAIAPAVLRAALQRLQVPADDPMQRVLALRPGEPLDEATRERSSDRSHTQAAEWLTRCRRTLRRQLGIGLASLVLRPAQLAATRSHIDVFFALNATDLRVRRHGLDLDPGWLPWFGRVVAFHFDRP